MHGALPDSVHWDLFENSDNSSFIFTDPICQGLQKKDINER